MVLKREANFERACHVFVRTYICFIIQCIYILHSYDVNK
jgi:hypothetical protein